MAAAPYTYKITYFDPLFNEDESANIDLGTAIVIDPTKAVESMYKEIFILARHLPNPTKYVNTLVYDLFHIPGVVAVEVLDYKVWIMKAPMFTWEEVMQPVIDRLGQGHQGGLTPTGNSANIDGTGFRLTRQDQQAASITRYNVIT
jgi:hypothetical protein